MLGAVLDDYNFKINSDKFFNRMGSSATKQQVRIGDILDLDLKVPGLEDKLGKNLKAILTTCIRIRRSIEAGQDYSYERQFET